MSFHANMYISTGKTMTPRAVPVEKRQKKSPTRDVASFTSPSPKTRLV